MKVSVKLCFCQFLSFFVLLVAETFAMINRDAGLTFGKAFQILYPSYKLSNPQKSCQTEIEEKERATQSSITNPGTLEVNDFHREFLQRLDHYDSTGIRYNKFFKQRYFVKKVNNYKKGNPVFLLVGGIDELQPCHLEEGIWNHFATESNALLLALEHRMHRHSFPFSEYSLQNLTCLDTEQALADLAYFMDELALNNPKDIDIPPDTKWIALGSAYGGTLAARLRSKFPHRVKAALTVNAPFLPTVAYEEFYIIVEKQCIMANIDNTIREAFEEFDKGYSRCDENDLDVIKCLKNKYKFFRQKFNICDCELSHKYEGKDHKYFGLWSLTTILGLALQYGNENKRTVKTDVIKILLNEEEISSPLDRFGEAVKLVLKSYNIPCLIVNYETLVQLYAYTPSDGESYLNYILYTAIGNRQTLYQRCTELGNFETTRKDGLFANLIPIEFYKDLCENVFGPAIHPKILERAIKRIAMFHGGREINVSNVLFIMRNDDIWSKLGYAGRVLLNEITEEDSITILLEEEDTEEAVSQDLIYKWDYVLRSLERWSEEIINENSEVSAQNTVIVVPIAGTSDDHQDSSNNDNA